VIIIARQANKGRGNFFMLLYGFKLNIEHRALNIEHY
jgi:hypothetical protein